MMTKDGRSIPHDIVESYRFAAVQLHKKGVSVGVMAESFGVTRKAVYEWLRRARHHGVKSLRSTKTPGRPSFLAAEQFKQLLTWLRQPATKLGYATDLWSGPRVGHLIRHRWGIHYHPKHLPRLLRQMGLELKFPQRRALEQDPKAVRRWKCVRWPEILKFAAKKRALVFYADECLVSLIPYVGKTWALPKDKPKVRVSGKRGEPVGITAAVNAQGRLCFELTQEKERFTAKTFLRFVRKLRREHPGRAMVLIVDGAPIHKAKLVQSFCEELHPAFRLEILPTYSPELNPSEKPWCFVKTKKMNASTAQNKTDLRREVKQVMQELKRDSPRVASFFVDLK